VVAAAGTTSTKQRIAIVEKVSLTGGTSTFELIPLSPGPLKRDSGTLAPGGDFTGYITRDGLRIQVGSGADNLTGANGTVRISGPFEHVPIAGSYAVDSGRWSMSAGTGSYASLSGGGRFAAVVLPSGRILARYEGYIRSG
jgi:hypothetical protein